MRNEQELHDAARKMSRAKVIEKLESVGIACFDNESDDKLETALVQNILDGNVAPAEPVKAPARSNAIPAGAQESTRRMKHER